MAVPPTGTSTVVSDRYLDIPTQRLLVVGALVASQAIKAGDFLANLADYNDLSSYRLLLKWCLLDAALLWSIPLLRIPRLAFDTRARTAQMILFFTLNWLLFGNYALSLGRFIPVPIRSILSIFEYDELAISQRRVRIQDVVDYGSHLLGQHTVRLSPISTARLNPGNLPFCLASPAMGVFIPILLNNTKSPSLISYSVAALADHGPRTYINVTSREIKKMQSAAASLIAEQEKLHGSNSLFDSEGDQDDEFDEQDGTVILHKKRELAERKKQQQQHILPYSISFSRSMLELEPTQQLIYLRITRPGLVRLERLLDQSGTDARISRRIGLVEATAVECPTARWGGEAKAGPLCASSGGKDVSIQVRGTAPMTLKWHHVGVKGEEEAFTVEGINASNEADGLPLAQDVSIPLTLRLNVPGIHVYSLDSLSDGAGNIVDLVGLTRAFTVLGRSSVSFRGCSTGPDKTLSLLQGKTTKLLVSLKEIDPLDAPWTVKIRYEPPAAPESHPKGKSIKMTAQPWTREFTIPHDKKTIAIEADKAGDYSIVSVSGGSCPGEVLSPETCRVIEQPLPTAEIEFKSIHECASDTGVTAIAVLHGTPPFVLYYAVKHDSNPPRTIAKTFNTQRAEIVLKPEKSGTYTYTFSHLTDKYYSKVPLEGSLSTTQRVHPLAVAQFVGGPNGVTASNCEGRSVELELELRGSPPFSVEMQLVGPKGSEVKTFSNLKNSREKVDVPIREDLDRIGGVMEVDLVSVQDATGCKRPLDVPGATVHVKRVKPTVKFYYPDGKKDILKLSGETAVLPLRLTGDGPWDVSYVMSHPGGTRVGDANRMRVSSANEKISVDHEGVFELLEVRDKHCPGLVVPEAATYEVRNVQKPSGVFSLSTGEITTTGTIIRRPVCVGVEDFADIDLEGRPPFQVRYRYSNGLRGRFGVVDHETLNTIQRTSRLQLRTLEPGQHEYHLTHFGDAAYPLQSLKDRPKNSVSRHSGTVLQHEVLSRPTADFKTVGPSSYCLNEHLVPRSGRYDDPTVLLAGKPPFKLSLNIKNVATSESRAIVVDVNSHEWKVDVPTYVLQTVGPHLITIESFEDSSPCPPSNVVDYERRTFRIDVAETAAIVPFDRREDWCVGDVLQFQLEGGAPWRVDYSFNGKAISATSKTPKFSRVAEKAGIFEITGVAHQQTSCQSEVSNMRFTIRDLPSARVSHGNIVYEDLREGDQAEILFTLIGTPPFTFTYQRASLETSSKRAPRILETHTVSGVIGHEYSIFSALEGTWSVTFIADKYCRYPPAPQRAEG